MDATRDGERLSASGCSLLSWLNSDAITVDLAMEFLTKSNFRPMVFPENTLQLRNEAVEGKFYVTADILKT